MKNRSSTTKDTSFDPLPWIFVLLLAAAAWLGVDRFHAKDGEVTFTSRQNSSPQDELKYINQKIKDLHFSNEARQERSFQENKELLYKDLVKQSNEDYLSDSYISNQFTQEASAEQAARELEDPWARPGLSPDERIRLEDYRKQLAQKYDNRYEAEFVRQLVTQAREEGYDLIINNNLELVGVKKLPKRIKAYRPPTDPY